VSLRLLNRTQKKRREGGRGEEEKKREEEREGAEQHAVGRLRHAVNESVALILKVSSQRPANAQPTPLKIDQGD
jgi:hypothetical protein